MLLAADSHRHIEAFHRHLTGDEKLRLPPVYLYGGRVARWVTHSFHIAAITFGRRIFVKPELISRDKDGGWLAPAWLVAHETTHVLQYEAAGFIGFLFAYLLDYWRCLRGQKGLGAAARMEAYRAIKVERAAREAEGAYAAWAANERGKMKAEG